MMQTETLDADLLTFYILHFRNRFYARTSVLETRKYLEPRMQGENTPSPENLREAQLWWEYSVEESKKQTLLLEYNAQSIAH